MSALQRRAFLQTCGASILTGRFFPRRLFGANPPAIGAPPPGPFLDESQATAAGQKLGLGAARLEGPDRARVFSLQTLRIVYTAGRSGVRPGGGIRLGLRHMAHLWNRVQNTQPETEGYLTTSAPPHVPTAVTVACDNWSKKYFPPCFPWQNIVEVLVRSPGLQPGESLSIIYGDTSAGSPGFRMQPFDETDFTFKTWVDPHGDGRFYPLAQNPRLAIVPETPQRLTIIVPSQVRVNQPTWCLLRAEDRFGNPAPEYRGTVRLSCTDSAARLPKPYTFTLDDHGVHRFENLVWPTPGIHTLTVNDNHARQSHSNPLEVAVGRRDRTLYWGDLHGHTLYSDGRDSVEQFYHLARHVEALDFCAVSDHAFQMLDAMWTHAKAVTNRANQSGRFVTFNAYEWSGVSKVGGDHNVYWLEDDPPLYRSLTLYHPQNRQMDHRPESKINHISTLLDRLEKHHLKDKNVFCIPHYGGRAAAWRWYHPKIQRLIEVFSEHRRSEDWMTPFLQHDRRLGIMASSDGHYGNPTHGYLKRNSPDPTRFDQEVGMALVAVYAPNLTRRSVFTALYDRHCYATTGDRIILDFRVAGRLMGSELSAPTNAPRVTLRAVGTADLTRVEILKNTQPVYTLEPNGPQIDLEWRDPDYSPQIPTFYYARIIQKNNEWAISSPVWLIPEI